jgi:predicted ArsR family transcriptional regulator
MGGLTFQVGHRLGWTASAVLSHFKALEKRGLVIRESTNPDYKRPLYWWPVGLADSLCKELKEKGL